MSTIKNREGKAKSFSFPRFERHFRTGRSAPCASQSSEFCSDCYNREFPAWSSGSDSESGSENSAADGSEKKSCWNSGWTGCCCCCSDFDCCSFCLSPLSDFIFCRGRSNIQENFGFISYYHLVPAGVFLEAFSPPQHRRGRSFQEVLCPEGRTAGLPC